eukprot:EG_transcript_386
MAVSLPKAVLLYLGDYLLHAANLLAEVLPGSAPVPPGAFLPSHVGFDASELENPRRFDPLRMMRVEGEVTLAAAITEMFDKWVQKALVDVLTLVRDTKGRRRAVEGAGGGAGLPPQLIPRLVAATRGRMQDRVARWDEERACLLGEVMHLRNALHAAPPADLPKRSGLLAAAPSLAPESPPPAPVPDDPATRFIVCLYAPWDGWASHPLQGRGVVEAFLNVTLRLFDAHHGAVALPLPGHCAALLFFDHVLHAATFCREVQAALDQLQWPAGAEQRPGPADRLRRPSQRSGSAVSVGLPCHIGVHSSDALRLAPCHRTLPPVPHGPDVHVAVRLCGVAPPRQPLVSADVVAALQSEALPRPFPLTYVGELRLRNVPVPTATWCLGPTRPTAPPRTTIQKLALIFDRWLTTLDYSGTYALPPMPSCTATVLKLRVSALPTLQRRVSAPALQRGLQQAAGAVRRVAIRHGGFELFPGPAGDSVTTLLFPQSREAVSAALAIRQAVARLQLPDELVRELRDVWGAVGDRAPPGLQLQMGAEHGPVALVVHAGEEPRPFEMCDEYLQLHGPTASSAYGLCEAARPGEVLLGLAALHDAALPAAGVQAEVVRVAGQPSHASINPPPLHCQPTVYDRRPPPPKWVPTPARPPPVGDAANVAGHMAVVALAVEYSAFLALACPSAFEEAIQVYHGLADTLLESFHGRAVLRHPMGVLVTVFDDPLNAALFTFAMQLEGLDCPWPPDVLRHREAGVFRNVEGEIVRRGLRIKCGIHLGLVSVLQFKEAKSAPDVHYGAALETAGLLCQAAPGGVVALSHSVYHALFHRLRGDLGDPVMRPWGAVAPPASPPESQLLMVPRGLQDRLPPTSPEEEAEAARKRADWDRRTKLFMPWLDLEHLEGQWARSPAQTAADEDWERQLFRALQRYFARRTQACGTLQAQDATRGHPLWAVVQRPFSMEDPDWGLLGTGRPGEREWMALRAVTPLCEVEVEDGEEAVALLAPGVPFQRPPRASSATATLAEADPHPAPEGEEGLVPPLSLHLASILHDSAVQPDDGDFGALGLSRSRSGPGISHQPFPRDNPFRTRQEIGTSEALSADEETSEEDSTMEVVTVSTLDLPGSAGALSFARASAVDLRNLGLSGDLSRSLVIEKSPSKVEPASIEEHCGSGGIGASGQELQRPSSQAATDRETLDYSASKGPSDPQDAQLQRSASCCTDLKGGDPSADLCQAAHCAAEYAGLLGRLLSLPPPGAVPPHPALGQFFAQRLSEAQCAEAWMGLVAAALPAAGAGPTAGDWAAGMAQLLQTDAGTGPPPLTASRAAPLRALLASLTRAFLAVAAHQHRVRALLLRHSQELRPLLGRRSKPPCKRNGAASVSETGHLPAEALCTATLAQLLLLVAGAPPDGWDWSPPVPEGSPAAGHGRTGTVRRRRQLPGVSHAPHALYTPHPSDLRRLLEANPPPRWVTDPTVPAPDPDAQPVPGPLRAGLPMQWPPDGPAHRREPPAGAGRRAAQLLGQH